MSTPIKNLIINYSRWIAWFMLCLYLVLVVVGIALRNSSGYPPSNTGSPILVLLLSWSVVGVLLIYRQPEHPIGWIFVSMPVVMALDEFALGYAYYGAIAYPGSLPYPNIAIVWTYWTGRVLSATWLTLLFLLFPTGHPMSRRWGKLVWVSITATILFVLTTAIAPLPIDPKPFPTDLIGGNPAIQDLFLPLTYIFYFAINVCTFLGILSLYIRLHRSSGVERLQIKWFLYASAFFIPGLLMLIIGFAEDSPAPPFVLYLGFLFLTIMIAGISIASAIAILRYRLYNIDILIRRTLVYGILTAVLIFLYFSAVALLQNMISATTGHQSPVVIVVSTLMIAVLFNPLRLRIQDIIDRRFYRKAYNSDKILHEFSVTVRNEVDMDSLAHEILTVADSTMQPEKISLWLKTD